MHSEGRANATRVEHYYPWFDWLRIALASLVVFSHAHVAPWEPSGNFAVHVFFALSGWLIGGILFRTRPQDVPRFYFARATRIWIPYALALTLLVAVSAAHDTITPVWLEVVFFKATFVYNLYGLPLLATHGPAMPLGSAGNHFWSICAEEQFYLLAPLLIVMRPRWGRSVLVWAALAVILAYATRYGALGLGVLAALLRERHGDYHVRRDVRLGAGAFVGVSLPLLLADYLPYDASVPYVSIGIVLLLAVPGPKQRLAHFLGGVSYPLYLNHWLGMAVAHSALKHLQVEERAAQAWLGYGLALAMASALYVLVDRRVLSRRDAWYDERLGRRVAWSAYVLTGFGLVAGAALLYTLP